MTRYLHTMYRITDPEKSRAFYEALSQLEQQGIRPEREPYRIREGGSRICFFQDPDGYRVELIDRSGK